MLPLLKNSTELGLLGGTPQPGTLSPAPTGGFHWPLATHSSKWLFLLSEGGSFLRQWPADALTVVRSTILVAKATALKERDLPTPQAGSGWGPQCPVPPAAPRSLDGQVASPACVEPLKSTIQRGQH